MSQCATITSIILLFLSLGGLFLALGTSNAGELTRNDELYAELGIVYSKVHFNGKTTIVLLDNYNLPSNSTTGTWGGPWFQGTEFHTYASLALATVICLIVFSCIQLAILFHRLRKPDYPKTAVVFLYFVNLVLYAVSAVAVGSMFAQKISGVHPVAAWGITGLSSAASTQFLFGLLLCCM